MTPEELEWYITTVKTRHEYLNLSNEQAKKIYTFENEKSSQSTKYALSIWEEWDFEKATFKEILNPEQIEKHKKYLEESIRMYEQGLVEQDKTEEGKISYYEELLNYYENQFLPSIQNDYSFNFGFLNSSKSKVDYLKAEYKVFLNDRKTEIITNHFRHNKTFKPNQLKSSLAWHKLLCALPDYAYFRQEMDAPTTETANFLVEKIRYFAHDKETFLTTKFSELEAFSNATFDKHHENSGGWHIGSIPLTPEEKREHRTMTLLLVDRNRYGF